MTASYRYVIHCERMRREEAFVAKDMMEFMRLVEEYIVRYGPIVLLYNVGRV